MDWRAGYYRLFMSHLAEYKAEVQGVSRELRKFGIDAFVAHVDIKPSRQWEDEILDALGSCHALALFLHDGTSQSAWIDQETGIAVGRDIKIVPLRMGTTDPYGFVAKYQAADCRRLNEAQIARRLLSILLDDEATRHDAEMGLIQAVVNAPSFDEANARAKRMDETIAEWTWSKATALELALNNNQVVNAFGAKPIVDRILKAFEAPF